MEVVGHSKWGCPRQHGGNETERAEACERWSELSGDARRINPRSKPSLGSRSVSWRHLSLREIVSLECKPYAVAKIEKNRRASSSKWRQPVALITPNGPGRRMNKFPLRALLFRGTICRRLGNRANQSWLDLL